MFRKSCSQCGAPVDSVNLENMDAALRADAERAAAFMGEPVASAWVCARAACGEYGFFGSVHASF